MGSEMCIRDSKDNGCDGYDRNGYLDDDCFGTQGYPVDPR